MIFIDASVYLSVLIPSDSRREAAVEIFGRLVKSDDDLITSYAVLGEVLTVGSQRYNRGLAIEFVEDILKGKTKIILEDYNLLDEAFKVFQKIKNKNVSWVDCFSFAIIEQNKIDSFFSFDKDFKKFAKAKSLL